MYNSLMEANIKELDTVFKENYIFQKSEILQEKGVFVYDFEVDSNHENAIVYASMLMDINDGQDTCFHTDNINLFIDNIENLPYKVSTLYAHNGSGFDCPFVLNGLIRKGYTIKQEEYILIDEEKQLYENKQFNLSLEPKEIRVLFKDGKFYKASVCVDRIVTEYYKRDGKNHKKGQPKKWTNKIVELKDSMLLLAGSLKDVCKSYLNLELSKAGLNYNSLREEGHKLTDSEKKYCYEDVFALKYLVKDVIERRFNVLDDEGFLISTYVMSEKLTSASLSLKVYKDFLYYMCVLTDKYKDIITNKELVDRIENFKQCIDYNKENKNKKALFRLIFPDVGSICDRYIRDSYIGGLVGTSEKFFKLNNNKDFSYKIDCDGTVLDENSMYPDKLRHYPLPFGKGKIYRKKDKNNFKLDKDKEFYINITVKGKVDLKKGRFPILRNSDIPSLGFKNKELFTTNKGKCFSITLTKADYNNFLDSYNVKSIKVNKIVYFSTTYGLFDLFVDYFYNIKSTKKGAEKQNAKLMLNSLYGKFGTKCINDISIVSSDDGYLSYNTSANNGKVLSDTVFVALASTITSLARQDLKTVAETVGVENVLYFDTDSLHLKISKNEVERVFKKIHKTKLGYWDIEGVFTKGIYLGAKRYAELLDGKKWNVKCCGLNDDVKSYLSNNIDLFDYANMTRKDCLKDFASKNITLSPDECYYMNKNGEPIIGLFPILKKRMTRTGAKLITTSYMINRK